MHHKPWKILSYLDDSDAEVDLIIDLGDRLTAVEIKSSSRVDDRAARSIRRFAKLTKRKTERIVVFLGDLAEKFDDGVLALPLTEFLADYVPSL